MASVQTMSPGFSLFSKLFLEEPTCKLPTSFTGFLFVKEIVRVSLLLIQLLRSHLSANFPVKMMIKHNDAFPLSQKKRTGKMSAVLRVDLYKWCFPKEMKQT